jgi:hypothetical protein
MRRALPPLPILTHDDVLKHRVFSIVIVIENVNCQLHELGRCGVD